MVGYYCCPRMRARVCVCVHVFVTWGYTNANDNTINPVIVPKRTHTAHGITHSAEFSVGTTGKRWFTRPSYTACVRYGSSHNDVMMEMMVMMPLGNLNIQTHLLLSSLDTMVDCIQKQIHAHFSSLDSRIIVWFRESYVFVYVARSSLRSLWIWHPLLVDCSMNHVALSAWIDIVAVFWTVDLNSVYPLKNKKRNITHVFC